MMAKIYLDPGHGGTDPGAVGNGIREKDVVLKIALYTRDFLRNNYDGANVRMSRSTDRTLSLSARTSDANSWGADVFVSIHINAGGGRGYEDFIYNGPVSSRTRRLQDAVHGEVSKHFETNRGQKRANYYVLRNTGMSAVLTENGFIDNSRDASFLKRDSKLREIAEAHADGIASFLGLKRKRVATMSSNSSVKIRTGGLTESNFLKVMRFVQDKGWYWDAFATDGENPKLRTGGLTASQKKSFTDWLDAQDFYWSEE